MVRELGPELKRCTPVGDLLCGANRYTNPASWRVGLALRLRGFTARWSHNNKEIYIWTVSMDSRKKKGKEIEAEIWSRSRVGGAVVVVALVNI